ncbi:MAG: alkaline phosphatase family protein, partial [Actinomycetales bacterium]|nr:alkaline phosphatase family protein [Actinomycetales bacterium]
MRYRLADLVDAALALLTTALGLGVAIFTLGGVELRSAWSLLLIAVLVAAGDYLTRPLLRLMAARTGAVGALLAGLAAQLLVLWGALEVVPGLTLAGPQVVPAVLLLAGAVMALGRWLIGVNDSEYVLGDVIRRARARARRTGTDVQPDSREPGLLVVLLDGVGRDTLGVAIEAGLAPTLYRWLRTGTHRLTTWWARVPSTTPASQAALLYGDSDAIPSFRWWDRDLGRLLVSNRPADAAEIERRLAAAEGATPLLGPRDAAISMMFSGGAGTNVLVMSRAGRDGIGPGPAFLRMFASPFVLVRSVVLTVAEMVKELFQGHRQRVRGVVPRVGRGGWYVVLRGITNVLLRDLNTSLVAEQLVRGTPVVVVDLVDYDEIAHHAGPQRPESLRALEGLDRVLGLLEQVCAVAPRDYRVVV